MIDEMKKEVIDAIEKHKIKFISIDVQKDTTYISISLEKPDDCGTPQEVLEKINKKNCINNDEES